MEKLRNDLSITEEHTNQIEKNVESVDEELKSIKENLDTSKDVNESLHKLDKSLSEASQLLDIVGIIPAISKEASTLKSIINDFHRPITKAVKDSDTVEKVIKPIRERIDQLEPKIEKIDHTLLNLNNNEHLFIATLGNAEQCISSLPDSQIKSELEEQMEEVSSTLDPEVLDFDRVQVELLKSIEEAKEHIEQIKSWARSLLVLNKYIIHVIDILSPLIKSLRAISAVFKKTIRVPYGGYPKICYHNTLAGKIPYPCGWVTTYFSFTIKQILNGLTGVIKPVEDLLNKAMDEILNPLLKALNLNIKLPDIPGIALLGELRDKLKGSFDPIFETFEELMNKLNDIINFIEELKKMIKKINEIYEKCQLNTSEES